MGDVINDCPFITSFMIAPSFHFGFCPAQEPDYVYVEGNGVDYDTEFKDIEDGPNVNFTFTPLEYDNYDVDQFGNLDLTKPKLTPPPANSNGKLLSHVRLKNYLFERKFQFYNEKIFDCPGVNLQTCIVIKN